MSQAEQVPEDMPAYLNHEPVGTGEPLASDTQCFLSTKSSFSRHVAHFGAVEMGNMKNEDSDSFSERYADNSTARVGHCSFNGSLLQG